MPREAFAIHFTASSRRSRSKPTQNPDKLQSKVGAGVHFHKSNDGDVQKIVMVQICRSRSEKLRRRSWSCRSPNGTSLDASLCTPGKNCVSTHIFKLEFLKSNLFYGNFVSFTPLDADPWIQVVQLARSQGNGLQIMFVFKAEPISFSKNMCVSFIKSGPWSPYSRACLSFESRASPSALVAWKMPPIGNLSKFLLQWDKATGKKGIELTFELPSFFSRNHPCRLHS